ncbi:MAG TPA: hypothetical protein VGH81_02955 [Rudaea sp.]|jgi:hypothetical protein
MRHAGLLLVVALALVACTHDDGEAPLVERIDWAPAEFVVYAEGTLDSTTPTPLLVPGSQWSQRQLRWTLADGSWVKKDEVVARFTAEQSKLSLATALVELQRNAIARAGKQDELGDTQGKLTVDLDQVAGLLGIAHRYANATETALARNKILDAVQDEHFLGVKQDTLNWRKGQSSTRGSAELALIDAQRATNDILARQSKDDLAALEVKAPHEGLLVLQPDWSGEKPKIGAAMWAGNAFASLPDTGNMQVEISLPQTEAQGLREGLAVELSPLGAPQQKIESTILWVAAAAATRSRESPVKYLSMKAKVPADAVTRWHWAPGQRFRATVILLHADKTLTVPNIALANDGDASASVTVRAGGRSETRNVHLGVRGPSRSQILGGLEAGESIVLGGIPVPLEKASATPTRAAVAGKAPP